MSISVNRCQLVSIGVNSSQLMSKAVNTCHNLDTIFKALYLGGIINPKNHKLMATFEKGILGGFSGKVGNVVGARWRGKNLILV
ncbi:hypothetical protein BWZ22_13745 [Seonamhaeicola sp. S2-3]|nr:hypothetical protein BWZ22_13745 [Seonamhaeicola sp. S2-3]